jgi:AcrR family transcriptional regulator
MSRDARNRPVRRVGRPPGPAPDRTARREELLDAATAAIRDIGADATMAELAAAAGITKPILYAHFGDKAGLAAAMAERAVAALNETLLAGLVVDEAPRQRMRATIEAFVSWIEREPQLYRFLVRGATGSDPSVEMVDLVRLIGDRITVVLGTALRAVGGDSGPAEVWSYGIIGAVFVAAEWWLTRPVVSRDQLVDDLCRLLWDGLGSVGLDTVPTAAVEHDVAHALGLE